MSTVLRLNGQGKAPTVHQPTLPADDQLDTRIAMIQALIPLEETLTLHRVGLADRLGVSLNTTNGLESILAVVEQRVGKVDRWTTSDQQQRWLATALLEIEPRLRRLRGYRALPQLRIALRNAVMQGKEVRVA
jgi:hypothetical protein